MLPVKTLRKRIIPAVLSTLVALAATFSVGIGGAVPVQATSAQAVVKMPFGGQWAWNATVNPDGNGNYSDSTSSHPSVHWTNPTTQSLWGDWATDIYPPDSIHDPGGEAVILNVTSPDGPVTFAYNNSNDTCGANVAGQGIVLKVLVNNVVVGLVDYEHLDNIASTYTNGQPIGYITQESLVSGCYTVRHVHVELKNSTAGTHACYVDHGHPGASLTQSDDLGVLGSASTAIRQACGSVPSGATATSTTSLIYTDGTEHIIVGDGAGSIQDISWGNGHPWSEYPVGSSIGANISHMTSQVLGNGAIQIAYSSGSNLWAMSWGNGVQPVPTGIATFSSTINALSSRVTSDGAFHVYVGAANGVWNISWGNGTPFVNVQVASNESANVTALSNQVTPDGYQNVYAGLGNGYVMHIYWTNPYQSGQWQPGTVGGSVVGIASQLVNGVTNIQVATATAVTNFRYGNGAPFSQTQVGYVSSMTITAIDSVVTSNGYQHALIGTSTGNLVDIWWLTASQATEQTQGVMPGAVVGLSTLLYNGVPQANGITSSEADNLTWYNGGSPSLVKESTYV